MPTAPKLSDAMADYTAAVLQAWLHLECNAGAPGASGTANRRTHGRGKQPDDLGTNRQVGAQGEQVTSTPPAGGPPRPPAFPRSPTMPTAAAAEKFILIRRCPTWSNYYLVAVTADTNAPEHALPGRFWSRMAALDAAVEILNPTQPRRKNDDHRPKRRRRRKTSRPRSQNR